MIEPSRMIRRDDVIDSTLRWCFGSIVSMRTSGPANDDDADNEMTPTRGYG